MKLKVNFEVLVLSEYFSGSVILFYNAQKRNQPIKPIEHSNMPHTVQYLTIFLMFSKYGYLLYLRYVNMEETNFSLSFQMLRMSTGHMEGDLQPLYLLLTDCYIYLLRKGKCRYRL